MRKIGCFGGSFDPIHLGHLEAAKHALKSCELDEVWFIPTLDNPLKKTVLSSYNQRVKMIHLTIQDEQQLACCEIEKNLPTPSYTIQTVRALKENYPEDDFYWIIGDDLVDQLPRWKAIDELLEEMTFIVLSRTEKEFQDSRFIYLKDFHFDSSSTQVRNGNFKNLDAKVRQFIFESGLYLENIVKEKCSEYRYKHSVSVAELACEIGQHHSIEPWKVYFAALLHDICKDFSMEELNRWTKAETLENLGGKKYLFHAYAAANWLKENLVMEDSMILKAIESHVEGTDESVLGLILYIADKLDRKRSNPFAEQEELIERAKQSKEKLKEIKEIIKEHFRENGGN